ncbi:MAG TPA: DUF763 domain-containing protein, partial [Ferruginibacter sp.]|nr:DUF763 domain-containing protein [Ferruginibacter sp.]
AIQDGFQLYTHNFIVSDKGDWTVIQQGMHVNDKTARRYHWHSDNIKSFVEEPHSGICGENMGTILNLTARAASITRNSIVDISHEKPPVILEEFRRLIMPAHHVVKENDVNLSRLGTILWLANEKQVSNFEELLLLQGVGPRTIQSLTLVSEVIHGTPSRFKDPARFSFAHGGKDGHPFPVPLKVYDETIATLQNAVERSKIGDKEKSVAIKKLHDISRRVEKDFIPNSNFEQVIQKEKDDSWKYGGRTVFGDAKPVKAKLSKIQLKLF